jgi:hypothetical protein
MIDIINNKYPQLNAVPYSEFTGSDDGGNGIWLRSEGVYIDDMPVHDCYHTDTTGKLYHFNTLSVLENLLQDNGWYSESYDAGTLMAYKI